MYPAIAVKECRTQREVSYKSNIIYTDTYYPLIVSCATASRASEEPCASVEDMGKGKDFRFVAAMRKTSDCVADCSAVVDVAELFASVWVKGVCGVAWGVVGEWDGRLFDVDKSEDPKRGREKVEERVAIVCKAA